ncbi:uncharacterized protein AB675_12120 [Cyphellophora attinorum]|uniref:GPI-anchored cell surface glycoprotein n=1 Tax=Cyphellophora attinorum TaxID=1664694 RepID=A0A0N0NKP0_9EURO|nr:uncharacterized protein AB675_12120 [Phialophora attinorum]KPI38371.1 hypothetical protein AB675_12120 [Phialophora attinorum]
MSLEGLETPAVVEAHQASIAEPTGWFLLKYAEGSRDTIEVYKRGTGGVSEARDAIESYPDKSPLYGMVQHRRRKVIVKYVPDGTSRLLLVRVKIQFQAVPDAFPHDVVFEITTATGLNDSALGMHTMLAPSIGSVTSSSSSLRKERLKDITEDAEEGGIAKKETTHGLAPEVATQSHVPVAIPTHRQEAPTVQPQEDMLDDLPASALRAKALLAMRNSPEIDVTDHDEQESRARSETPLKHALSDASREQKPSAYTSASPPILPPIVPVSTDFDKALPAPPATEDVAPQQSAKALPVEEFVAHQPPARSTTAPDLKHSPHLTAGESESISLWSSEVAQFVPQPKKKKLGPRPHVEPPGRPRTSGASDNNVRTRTTAGLPNTVKVATDRARMPMSLRPSSQQSSKSVPGRFPSSQSVTNHPPMPSPTHIPHFQRPESRSVVGRTPSMTSEMSVNATPEKIRLMKALQMRKRNMLATQRSSLSPMLPAEHSPQGQNGYLPDSNGGTPTPTTFASERAEESSFTSREEPENRRGSLSSDTSSSITPKADESEKPKPKAVKPEKREDRSRLAAPPIAEVDSDDEISNSTQDNQVDSFPAPPRSPVPPASPGPPAKDTIPRKPVAATAAQSTPSPSDHSPSRPANPKRLSMSNVASRVKKGLSIPQPLQTTNSADVSGDSDAESFMDELENATVQEAKPVIVARTPVTPVMSAPAIFRDGNRNGTNGFQPRSSSANYIQERSQALGSRSSSALNNWPPMPNEQQGAPLTKKSSLGTGISKRIKALEVLSTRDSTSPPRQPVRDIPSKRSAFETFMKRSSFVKPNASTDKPPPKKVPETMPVGPIATNVGPAASDPAAFAPPAKGEAVSVTARIIRRDEHLPPSTAPGDLNLHRSPLIVEHERKNIDGRAVSRGRTADPPRSPVKEKGRFSFSSYRSMTQSASQPARLNTADSSSKLSLSSRAKMPRSMSDNSSLTEEKKGGSRTHRLMKRVSNLTGRKSQKNLAAKSEVDLHREQHPETIDERMEGDDRTVTSNNESLLHVVDIGDVNVQFPDTLLWKRRFMRIDDQGYLIFSPPANDPSIRNVSRKYHLADIRTPTLPDLEREQMAWSVFLDMRDGTCIQCACESRAMQQQVLQMLVDAHSAYSQLYGT